MAAKCAGFHNGCTCPPCMVRYYTQHANSCTYGQNYVGRQLSAAILNGAKVGKDD